MTEKLDMTNMAYRAGVLQGVLKAALTDLTVARSLPTRQQRDERMDNIAKMISGTLTLVADADGQIQARVDACRAAGPETSYRR